MCDSGRTPHGVRGLKSNDRLCAYLDDGRTPHGVRGLKYTAPAHDGSRMESHPSRGAWIEILPCSASNARTPSRTPHGVRGLKSLQVRATPRLTRRRTPHGVRGLKFIGISDYEYALRSHPSRGAWIEIGCEQIPGRLDGCRTPHGVRGLKSQNPVRKYRVPRRTPHGVRGLKYGGRAGVRRGAGGRTPHGVRGLK